MYITLAASVASFGDLGIEDFNGAKAVSGTMYKRRIDRVGKEGSRCIVQCAFTSGEIWALRLVRNLVGVVWGYRGWSGRAYNIFLLFAGCIELSSFCSSGTSFKALHRNEVSFCSRCAKSIVANWCNESPRRQSPSTMRSIISRFERVSLPVVFLRISSYSDRSFWMFSAGSWR